MLKSDRPRESKTSDGNGFLRKETVMDGSNSGGAFVGRGTARSGPTGAATVAPLALAAGRVSFAICPAGFFLFKTEG